ncbi:MAG: flagellar basal body rod protein FlgC [Bacillota bacterium]
MSMFPDFRISGSALTAEKTRLDTIAGNIANMNTTRTVEGGPYRRRTVTFAEDLAESWNRRRITEPLVPSKQQSRTYPGQGVRIDQILADHRDPMLVYDPEHPDAQEDGYVMYPNVELSKEMTDMITAHRSYEANTTAVQTAKSLYMKALEIGR